MQEKPLRSEEGSLNSRMATWKIVWSHPLYFPLAGLLKSASHISHRIFTRPGDQMQVSRQAMLCSRGRLEIPRISTEPQFKMSPTNQPHATYYYESLVVPLVCQAAGWRKDKLFKTPFIYLQAVRAKTIYPEAVQMQRKCLYDLNPFFFMGILKHTNEYPNLET